jgi:hypothetical protein
MDFFCFWKLARDNLPGFKPAKYVSDEQYSFEKLASHRLPLLKAGQG